MKTSIDKVEIYKDADWGVYSNEIYIEFNEDDNPIRVSDLPYYGNPYKYGLSRGDIYFIQRKAQDLANDFSYIGGYIFNIRTRKWYKTERYD